MFIITFKFFVYIKLVDGIIWRGSILNIGELEMKKNLTDQCEAGDNSEIIKQFLEYRTANSKGESTLKSDKMILNLFLKFLNNKPLEEITEKDAERYINSLKSLGNKTNIGSKLILFFRWFQNKSIKEGKNKLTKRDRPDIMRWF